MAHGQKITAAVAKVRIRKFVDDERIRTGKPESEIAVGHQFDLQLLRDFLTDIDLHIQNGDPIDSFRIYMAKSNRGPWANEYDIVMVPTLSNGNDLPEVYNKEALASPIVLSDSTPCPNVCNGTEKKLSCP